MGRYVRLKDCAITPDHAKQLFGIGGTAALSNLMQSVTVILTNQYLLPYGNDRIAAMGVVMKITMIAVLVLVGFSFGGVPVFGYLYGAKRNDELKKLVRFCLCFLSAISLALTVVLFVSADSVIGMFLSDAALIEIGVPMLRYQVAGTVFVGVVQLLTVLFQATGKVLPSFILSISRQGVVFFAAIVVCAQLFGYQGVLMGQAAADVVSAIIAVVLFYLYMRR